MGLQPQSDRGRLCAAPAGAPEGGHADLVQHTPDNGLDVHLRSGANLTCDDDAASHSHDLHSNMSAFVLVQVGIEDGISDFIAQLVRMPFADRFCGLESNIHINFLSVPAAVAPLHRPLE